MRPDMGRVVIERPRRGSGNPTAKVRHFGHFNEDGEYEGPMRLPSSGDKLRAFHPKIGDKSFTDVLGPIRGFLFKSVGRPWDDVFREISQTLGKGGYPIRHVLHDHLLGDVARCVEIAPNGHFYEAGRRGDTGKVSGFYVHPKTRRLAYVQPRSWRWKPEPQRHETDRVKIDGQRYFVKIDGLWFTGAYRQPEFECAEVRGVRRRTFQNDVLDWPNFNSRQDGIQIFQVEKSASKKDLKLLALLRNGR